MKKIQYIILMLISLFISLSLNVKVVEAKTSINSKNITTLTGEKLGSMEIFSDGEIVIKYKYGLKKANLFFCEKNHTCEYDVYSVISLVDADSQNPHKNTDINEFAKYTYKADLEKEKEYLFRLEAYFGKSNYQGNESLSGSPSITSLQVLDTNDVYINGKDAKNNVGDENIKGLLDDLLEITNTIILPILYSIIGMVLVVKGILLGVQIVKSADMPQERAEKVHALKWLVIGVTIAFAASSLVGLLTGFFKTVFN